MGGKIGWSLVALVVCSVVLMVESAKVTTVGNTIGCGSGLSPGRMNPAARREAFDVSDAKEDLEIDGANLSPEAAVIPPGEDVVMPVNQSQVIYIQVTVTELLTMGNTYSNTFCTTESLTSLTVDDGQVRQVVGPIAVGSDLLVSNSTLVLQAQVQVAQDLDLVESNLIVMNTTSVAGKTTIDEKSSSTLVAALSTNSFALHQNGSVSFGHKSETRLPQDPLLLVQSCDVVLNGTFAAALNDYQIGLILNALNYSDNFTYPLLQAQCDHHIPTPSAPPFLIRTTKNSNFTLITTTLLLKVGTTPSDPGTTTFSMIFSLRGSSSSPSDQPSSPSSPSTSPLSRSSNRNAIIIGASIGGAVALVALIALLVLTIKPLNHLVFPHRRRALAQRHSI